MIRHILAALIVLRITCVPASIRLYDERGEPLAMQWRTDGTVAVERMPGAVAVETFDQDCGAVRFHMRGGGRWWRATVECGAGTRFVDLRRERE